MRMKYKRDTQTTRPTTHSTLFFGSIAGPGPSSPLSSFGAGFSLGLDVASCLHRPPWRLPLLGRRTSATFLFTGFLLGKSSASPSLLLSVGLPSSDVTNRKSSSSSPLPPPLRLGFSESEEQLCAFLRHHWGPDLRPLLCRLRLRS
jgi:hypothetical protein